MAISDRTRIAIPFIVRITVVGALAGAIYGYFAATAVGGPGVYGIERGLVTGAIIASVLVCINLFVLPALFGAGKRRAPFLLHIGLKSLIYFLVLLLGSTAGRLLFPVPSVTGAGVSLGDVVFFFAVAFVISFLLDLNSLLGQNVLVSFVTGRYFRPRVEQRIVLFIDMKNSTAAAERLGEVEFHRLLNRFVSDVSGAIVMQKGQIHKYSGDELIVTWPLAAGLRNARCLRACFGAIQKLADLGPSYAREFGLAVDVRAGLHCGSVVVGEMGTIKKEIALIGDTMNTAARIVDACRERNESVIASAALLRQLAMPPAIVARPLGPIQLRGRKGPVELSALQPAAVPRREASNAVLSPIAADPAAVLRVHRSP